MDRQSFVCPPQKQLLPQLLLIFFGLACKPMISFFSSYLYSALYEKRSFALE